MGNRDSQIHTELAAIPLFEGLTPNHLEELAGIVAEPTYKRGEVIFSEGEPCTGFYVSIAGRAKVYKVSGEGKEQILHLFGPHQPFGEVPVFEGGHYPANAVAMDNCRLLFFPRADFIALIEADPSLSLRMLAILSRRLRQFAGLIEALSLKEVPGRLAAHLLQLGEHAKDPEIVHLEVSKGQLASLLGTIPETLSRVLAKMAGEGLIRPTGPRSFELLDLEGLEELAEGERRLG